MKMDLRGSFVRGDTASVQSAEGRDRIVKNRFTFFCSDHCCIHDHYHIISSYQSEKSR